MLENSLVFSVRVGTSLSWDKPKLGAQPPEAVGLKVCSLRSPLVL